jgi:hypothetical protein
MVDSWLERDLNGVGMLARSPIPVREAGKEVLVRANRRGGGGSWSARRRRKGVSRIKVNASGKQDVVELMLLCVFSATCKRDGGFVSLSVYTI